MNGSQLGQNGTQFVVLQTICNVANYSPGREMHRYQLISAGGRLDHATFVSGKWSGTGYGHVFGWLNQAE